MKIVFVGGGLEVTREPSDKRYYGNHMAKGESNFLHDLKNELNKKGFELIKKRMWKDGHLMDDIQQYLRTTNKNSKAPHVYLWNGSFALYGLNDRFNEGKVFVNMTFDIFECQPNCVELVNQLLHSNPVNA